MGLLSVGSIYLNGLKFIRIKKHELYFSSAKISVREGRYRWCVTASTVSKPQQTSLGCKKNIHSWSTSACRFTEKKFDKANDTKLQQYVRSTDSTFISTNNLSYLLVVFNFFECCLLVSSFSEFNA